MQAIIFPNTYISETVCEAVRTCFQPVRIYQPTGRGIPPTLQALSQKGLIDMIIPARNDDEKIEILVRDYRSWAQLHQGGSRDYLKRQGDAIPFFDDTAIAQIKADVKQTARTPETPDPLFNARVFLRIAQEYDMQSEEISRQLDLMNQAERNLFINITGEPEDPPRNALRSPAGSSADSAGYMFLSRMTAWVHLFLEDFASDREETPTAFVTGQRETIKFLIEKTPAAEQILKVISLPVIEPFAPGYGNWRNRFDRILESLPENADETAAELAARFQAMNPSRPKVDLTLYRIPGESPSAFFARCIDRPLLLAGKGPPEKGDYTLLGLIEMDSDRLKTEVQDKG